jgi:site-specific recombinase XerD
MLAFFEQYLQQLGKSQATRQAYAQEAKKFIEFATDTTDDQSYLTWGKPEFDYYFAHLRSSGLSENSLRRGFLALKLFFQFLVDTKRLKGENPMIAIAIPKREDTDPEIISASQWQSLIESRELLASEDASRKEKHLRDLVLLFLLGAEGLKASEVIGLRWSFFLKDSLHVPGKHPRVLKLADATQNAIAAYKEHLKDELKYLNKAYLFRGLKGPRSADKPMSRHGLKFILAEFANELGIPKLNAECLRSHTALCKLRIGWQPEQVMEHLGISKLGIVGKVQNFAKRKGLL